MRWRVGGGGRGKEPEFRSSGSARLRRDGKSVPNAFQKENGAAFVSMADKGASARIAGAAAFVSMADGGASARIVLEAAAIRVPCAS